MARLDQTAEEAFFREDLVLEALVTLLIDIYKAIEMRGSADPELGILARRMSELMLSLNVVRDLAANRPICGYLA